MAITKKQFKKKWESNDEGGGITFEDIADCAKKWGLFNKPMIHDIYSVRYSVLKAAKTVDYKEYDPDLIKE